MKYPVLLIVLSIYTSLSWGQNSFKAIVKDGETMEPLYGATVLVQGTNNGGISDHEGLVEIRNIPDGKQVLDIPVCWL